jgi:hypothetical protein
LGWNGQAERLGKTAAYSTLATELQCDGVKSSEAFSAASISRIRGVNPFIAWYGDYLGV